MAKDRVKKDGAVCVCVGLKNFPTNTSADNIYLDVRNI